MERLPSLSTDENTSSQSARQVINFNGSNNRVVVTTGNQSIPSTTNTSTTTPGIFLFNFNTLSLCTSRLSYLYSNGETIKK